MHISSSYAKILGEKLFRTWEFPRSGSKATDGEKKKKRRERLNDGDNNGQATHGARKHTWRTQAAWANLRLHLTLLYKHSSTVFDFKDMSIEKLFEKCVRVPPQKNVGV